VSADKPLTPKQQRFCEEYIVDLNATQAAIRAGYSKKTAGSQGHDLLKKPEIQNFVSSLAEARSEKTKITAENVLRELSLMGFANMQDYMTVQENGTAFVDLSQLTRDQAAAIQEIVTDEYWEGRGEDAVPVKKIKFKLADKRGSLELLGKHLVLFGDKVTHDGTVTVKVEHAGGDSLAE
jgi:phage terminase small subunit